MLTKQMRVFRGVIAKANIMRAARRDGGGKPPIPHWAAEMLPPACWCLFYSGLGTVQHTVQQWLNEDRNLHPKWDVAFRPVDFSNFYGPYGKPLLSKVRRLIQIRKGGAQFQQGDYNFYNADYYTDQGLLVFSRSLSSNFSLVALNFTGVDQSTTVKFPKAGTYIEEIDGVNTLTNVAANVPVSVTIPSNYGQIWTL